MYVLLLGKASRHHCPDSTHRPLGNKVRIARAERAHGVLIGDGWSCSDSSPNIACFIGTSEREPRSPQPSRMDIPPPIGGAAAFAAAIALAANGMGPLDKRWLAQVADMCDQYPQGDVYSDTVAERMACSRARLAPICATRWTRAEERRSPPKPFPGSAGRRNRISTGYHRVRLRHELGPAVHRLSYSHQAGTPSIRIRLWRDSTTIPSSVV